MAASADGSSWSASTGLVPPPVLAAAGPRIAELTPRPGPVWGAYPLRAPAAWPTRAWQAWLRQRMRQPVRSGLQDAAALLHQTRRHGRALEALSTPAFGLMVQRARLQLLAGGLNDGNCALALAVVADAARRELGLTAYDSQLWAARAMLRNSLVEMGTGEGKTLAALLSAAAAALAGVPVHVLTSNDYLAQRDADTLRPVYAALGLSVGCVQGPDSEAQRRAAYACDVTYATAREVAFDHLRDRLGAETSRADGEGRPAGHARPVLRGLCMAVLDEADSVLIDEAAMPLILSQQTPDDDTKRLRLALFLARQLVPGQQVQQVQPGEWTYTEAGRAWLDTRAQGLGAEWRIRRFREETVALALAALHDFRRDRDYVVHDGEVQIVDVHTGRRAQGRSWSRGLHQLIALKEGLHPAPATRTLAQMSFQQFFPRYLRLCGQSGTLWEARHELLAVYGLPVLRVAPHRPSQRRALPTRVLPTAAVRWAAVLQQVRAMHAQGRPVLVGTASVEDSRHLSDLLAAEGLPHRVLSASQDADEAAVVAAAGARGAITVATQMAGRGTDVHVADAEAELGGLHVVNAGLHPARRIDRQLAGRAARRGQPGSHQRLLALDDEGLQRQAPAWLRWMLARAALGGGAFSRLRQGLASWLVQVAQRQLEAQARRERWTLLQREERLAAHLAWSGRHPWD